MPNGRSDNPFETSPSGGQIEEGPLRGASDWLKALTDDPTDIARGRLASAGMSDFGGRPWSVSTGWQGRLLNGAQQNMGAAANPYSEAYANQSRAAQGALINQMRAQMNGPSLAAMQGQRALGQSGQQALGAAAMGAPARAAMLQAQRGAAGLAGDVGQARLAEVMRAQGGMGSLAAQMRGGDQQTALQSAAAHLEAQKNRDAMMRFYTQTGVGSSLDDLTYQLDRNKISNRVLRNAKDESNKAWGDFAQVWASLMSNGMMGGGK